ncbi:glucose-6-phosphate isomerase [Agrilutibacter solisilvae]|uniref:Glucose-6-phosphate isomerase n=1 Tax=Agrilutibacter solisilvae TaxID=2763317 RepID=A0A974XWW0_9GAMM|nr:glucose-6-phosphate isomerase [Lysobacter solisilvae]QSX77337.1 glucose-6-phosphate isomerase [Lysobacter solisilvae]
MEATTRFERLQAHARRLAGEGVSASADAARAQALALRVGPVYANFARQSYDTAALDELFAQLDALDGAGRIRALFDGAQVNPTEGRPALHTALRSNLSQSAASRDGYTQAVDARRRMGAMIRALAQTPVSDVVSVGIGGSDLGPRLAVDALGGDASRFRVHFLSNVDGSAARRVLAGLDPARTAAILISKSFGTQETLLNGAILRDWLGDDSRLYAVTANGDRAAAAFAIPSSRILPMWDWVGGRYSLWSAVGLPIALSTGMEAFEALLEGAAAMDAHVLDTPVRANLAAWHALTAVWNANACQHATQAVIAYDERLRLLPSYLQQLVMESLGKSVTLDGQRVGYPTVPVWWGGAGTDSQHSFFQALHQGTQQVPIEFIGVVRPDHGHRANHEALLSNLLAQAQALATGQGDADPHRRYEGGRPSTTILLDALTPYALGALLAMYEHSVYLQAAWWGINPFDQFGVELGKQVADALLPAIREGAAVDDAVTQALLDQLRRED